MAVVRFIDLFAGTGGMRLGFQSAMSKLGLHFDCMFSSEIDPKAVETYCLNFDERPQGDITTSKDSIPPFDFLLAGFPCQPFSYAGKKRGFGDTRGTLFFEVEQIIRRRRPKGFLLENVRGLVTHDRGRTMNTILQRLRGLGYATTYIVCNSCNFSVPQNRVRVYIVGTLSDQVNLSLRSDVGPADSHKFRAANSQRTFFDVEPRTTIVSEILEEEPDPKYRCSISFYLKLARAVSGDMSRLHGIRLIDYRGGHSLHSWDLGIKGDCSEDERAFMTKLVENRRRKVFGAHQDGKMLTVAQIRSFFDHPHLEKLIASLINKRYLKCVDGKYNPVCGNMSFEVFKFLDPESISVTLTSSDTHKLGVVQNGMPRRITPREAARLQGFPDTFRLHPNDSATYRQMGNAVSVPVIEKIIVDMFENNTALLANEELRASQGRVKDAGNKLRVAS